MYNFREWKHVFKLDPNKEIDDHSLELICESGTDAILVGGSDGITLDNTLDMLARIRRYTVPCVLEVSTIESITPGFDFYFIPTVLNSQNVRWITGLHHEAMKEFGDIINWDEIVMEGYCIVNGNSKAATLTEALASLDNEDVVAYARMAENLFRLPIFYLEYSGEYGDITTIKAAKSVLTNTRLFYGGGIESVQQAEEISAIADTTVVGNVIYENFTEALKTVKAVKKK